MTMKSINFDHISANPLLPEVKKAMIEAINEDYHNPASQPVNKLQKPWNWRVNPWQN